MKTATPRSSSTPPRTSSRSSSSSSSRRSSSSNSRRSGRSSSVRRSGSAKKSSAARKATTAKKGSAARTRDKVSLGSEALQPASKANPLAGKLAETFSAARSGATGQEGDLKPSTPFEDNSLPQTTEELFNHTVEKGETVNGIATDLLRQSGFENPSAQQVAGGVDGIVKANEGSLSNPDKIVPGQQLSLPRDLAEGPVFQRFADNIEKTGQEGLKSRVADVEMARLMRADNPPPMTDGASMQQSAIGDRFNSLMEQTGRPVLAVDSRSGVDQNGLTHSIFQAAGIDSNGELQVHGFGGGVDD